MRLQQMKDNDLNLGLLKMVQQERKLTSQILDFLKEVEDRKLFAKRGYSSLFAYCTEYLGYSESAAQRRISAMRLIKEVPQVKENITSGELNLSNVAKVAQFFRQEKKIHQKVYTPKEKVNILENLKGKTQKEAEIELIQISPRPFQDVDKERAISVDVTELRMTLDQETMKKLNRLRELKPGLKTQELLNWMLTRCLKQVDPMEKPTRPTQPHKPKTSDQPKKLPKKSPPQRLCENFQYESLQAQDKKDSSQNVPQSQDTLDLSQNAPQSQDKNSNQSSPQPLRQKLSQAVKREVWERAQGCCQFKDHRSGRECQSRAGLEIDHVQPLSLGGDDSLENLRLLCRQHHKLFTEDSFYRSQWA